MPRTIPSAPETAPESEDGSPVPPRNLEADIEQLKADIANLAKQFQVTGEHSIGTARRAAAEGVGQFREKVRSGASDLETQLAESVREKPLTALGIAAGIGFLFALMTRR